MYHHQPYGSSYPQRPLSVQSSKKGSFDEQKQTQTVIDGYFEASSSKLDAPPRHLNLASQHKLPVQSEYFQTDVNMETESLSALSIVPQSGGGEPSWTSMDMSVDEPHNVPVLPQNYRAANPFANFSTHLALPPSIAKSPPGYTDHQGPSNQMWRQDLQQQQPRRALPTTVGYPHPYAQKAPGGSVTLDHNSSIGQQRPTSSQLTHYPITLSAKEQQQGPIATKKSNAVRGSGQDNKYSKAKGVMDNDPTLTHPGGIRMKTIQYIYSIQQFLDGTVLSPVGTGKVVLVEVIGKLIAEPSRSDYCWTYSLRDPTLRDFANSFPKARELFVQPQLALAGNSEMKLRCHYYDIDKALDLDLMEPGQIVRTIGVVNSQSLDSNESRSLQLVTIRR
ncbi:hypothetical protein EMPS_07722 [Entomortierella parvispora]|uniref:Uncharacterized protein n=1 Tax=Entomortierella parvispora TaxID=205924 RepID=A0A9P3HEQ3_9FUNG|nr:hypothetical protein EMPS_07722 [Entomortierella parvispora]